MDSVDFAARELAVNGVGEERFERMVKQVAEFEVRPDEEIARVYVAVMFDDEIDVAGRPEYTHTSPAENVVVQDSVERPDRYGLVPFCLPPYIEQLAQKPAIPFGRGRERRYLAGFGMGLDTWYKLQKLEVLFDHPLVYVSRAIFVGFTYYRKNIKAHVVFPAQFGRSHNVFPYTATGSVDTVHVMYIFGPVDAQTDQKLVLREKPGPFFVNQHTVGLKRVAYLLARQTVALLQLNRILKKVQSHKGRFAALPAEDCARKPMAHQVGGHFFKDIMRHPMLVLVGIHTFLGHTTIETVFTRGVTVGRRGFY